MKKMKLTKFLGKYKTHCRKYRLKFYVVINWNNYKELVLTEKFPLSGKINRWYINYIKYALKMT